MPNVRRILLKITGETIAHTKRGLDAHWVKIIAQQIKKLPTVKFGIVIGGGNFFRGAQQGKEVDISENVGHYVGMLATMMNGLIIQDIFAQEGLSSALLSGMPCESVAHTVSPQEIAYALENKDCVLFAGGTGNPYFSTDTTAVLRALQINADELWKGTKVDGIYTDDPKKNPNAQLIKKLTYHDALEKNYHVMDAAAYALAQEHTIPTRIFDIFDDNALYKAASDKTFGSTIY